MAAARPMPLQCRKSGPVVLPPYFQNEREVSIFLRSLSFLGSAIAGRAGLCFLLPAEAPLGTEAAHELWGWPRPAGRETLRATGSAGRAWKQESSLDTAGKDPASWEVSCVAECPGQRFGCQPAKATLGTPAGCPYVRPAPAGFYLHLITDSSARYKCFHSQVNTNPVLCVQMS